MKCTIILLLAACLQVSANGHAQTISVQFRDVSFEKALKEVARKSGYQVFYQQVQIKQAKPVSISKENTDVREVLKEMFKEQPLKYEIANKTIVVSVKEEKSASSLILGLNPRLKLPDSPIVDVRGKVTDESGRPVVGASVLVKGTSKGTATDENGAFSLVGVDEKATLIISAINIETREIAVGGRTQIDLMVKTKSSTLEEVEVTINTGYQQIPKERSTGSFTQVDQQLLQRSTAPDILSRLEGVSNGLLFNSSTTKGGSVTGITIRGTSTISPFVSRDPLIVVDNFPYEGDIRNINPNDIASVTILKDAVAASVWGARSGNGVIVITTKKGSNNRKAVVEFNMNRTHSPIPDLYYNQKFLTSSGYIQAERFLFDQGYYNQALNDKVNYPAVSPVVELLNRHKNGQITSSVLQSSLNALSAIDVRKDAERYFYRSMAAQQYALNIRGGATNMSYYLGLGYDRSDEHLQGNYRDRFTVTSINTFSPVKNLLITGSVIISLNKSKTPNTAGWGPSLTSINRFYPYASVADGSGNPLTINFGKRNSYQDSLRKLGFLDWGYRPLEELSLTDNQQRQSSIVLRGSVKYSIIPSLTIDLNLQTERQSIDGRIFQPEESYAVRSLINRFSAYDVSTGTFTYQFPRGGILQNARTELTSNNLRLQSNYSKTWGDHMINALVGAEIRETKTTSYQRASYGYNDRYGASVNVINYTTMFPTNGGGSAFIPPLPGGTIGTTQRFISYYSVAGYTYKKIYSLNVTARKDGANLFGVRTNDRITPLWSIGSGYDISRAKFYNLSWLPSLKLRVTYGFNGNVYRGAAYLTASYGNISSLTNLPYGTINTAPNSELRWERVRNINFGADFELKGAKVTGSLEYYIKHGIDLVQDQVISPSTGFNSYQGNSASTRTKGLELQLNTVNIDQAVKWTTNFIINYNIDKVNEIQNKTVARMLANSDFGDMYPGNYILGMYSYQWMGIDPANGDPVGYLNKAVSKNYTSIVNDTKVEDLVYSGSARPLIFGAVRNTISYKRFSLSANITYKLKYFFRKNTVNLNYQELGAGGMHSDYYSRWTQPGDEQHTSVPSLRYVTDINRNLFYRNSSVNIEKGDHIRLTDIAISYDVPVKGLTFKSLQVYSYINNIGILWRANNAGIDPDWVAEYALPAQVSYTLGVRANF